jgi:hypothetical protein
MVPREARRGQSFNGAGLYYLHDKDALTSERVAFTYTENVPTQDSEKALKWMAWTAKHADELKRKSGAGRTGRACTKPVYCFSLAWHPEEQPKKEEMIAAGRQALGVLSLQEHETLMVAHNDEAHPHLHLIVNVIHPQTGKANTLAYSKLKLSKWAERYEQEHGKIYCQQRVENNERRAGGEKVKYREPELDLRAQVTKLYLASDNGKAFQVALAEHGYSLAQGKRIVLIDREGKMHSLTRQIEGVKAKAIRGKLRELQLPEAGEARGQQGREENGKEAKLQPRQKTAIERHTEAQDPPRYPTPPHVINRTQDRHIDELGHFYTESQNKRVRLGAVLDQQYCQSERHLRQEIAQLDETMKNSSKARLWWLKLTGQLAKTAEEDLANMRRSLENIEWRKSEAQSALENEIRERGQAIKTRQEKERREVEAKPSLPHEAADQNPLSPARDFEKATQEHASEVDARTAHIARRRQQQRDRGPSRDRS